MLDLQNLPDPQFSKHIFERKEEKGWANKIFLKEKKNEINLACYLFACWSKHIYLNQRISSGMRRL